MARILYKNWAAFFCMLCLCIFAINSCSSRSPQPSAKPGQPKPYRVGKTWYYPVSDATNFRQRGKASWYGKKFHGKKTSNGEIYDMYAMTAAHKTLPLGTYVRVHNLANNKSIEVRINDRGPFVRGRIIDLSYTAAKALDVVGPGTAPVEIVALGKANTSGGKNPSDFITVDFYSGNFTFQVGAFGEKENAIRLKQKLEEKYMNVHIVPYDDGKRVMYRVRVGRTSSLKQAEEYENILIQQGFNSAFIVAE
ncbi:MAG: septal ring lytic transglycosylase RlpA family protein [Deltaproteobacteria bacterium]|nr:septal ring lytic transglycosylase RlpA family protein [Deltaproteobacteria bacterium]MBW2175861.1 septal ring lytic transglycosylase RlpA family protein [Deltaproteobacteria bacterium]